MKAVRSIVSLAMTACPLLLLGADAQAASYPDRPVKIVVGAGPGGSIDTLSRAVAGALSKRWKQPVIVENREGASHSIAAAYVAKAKPDGYTLMMINSNLTFPNKNRANAGVDTLKSFVPISLVSQNPNVLAVNPKASNYKTAQDLIDGIRKKANGGTYGSAGPSSTNYFVARQLSQRAGIRLRPVVYEGGGEIALGLLRGEVDFITGGAAVLGHAESGALKTLAVTTAKRSPLFPDLPPIAEALNLPGFDEFDWQGMVAPAGTPQEILSQVQADLSAIAADRELQDQLARLLGTFVISTPTEFGRFLAAKVAEGEEIVAQTAQEKR
jgi:tripartite-type tricarboxylate transporter receptor subunit TctC